MLITSSMLFALRVSLPIKIRTLHRQPYQWMHHPNLPFEQTLIAVLNTQTVFYFFTWKDGVFWEY
jgi:hypothetical protein